MDNKNEIKIEKKCQRNRITVLLISFYSGIIGISDLGLKYYLKDQNEMNPSTFAQILLIIKVAYLIKPIYGLLIDFIPIFGYKKKIYLFICFFINGLSWFLFIIKISNNLIILIIFHIIINISISFTAVIGNSIQLEISKLQDKQKIFSSKTFNLMYQKHLVKAIGTLIPSFFKGFLIEKYSYDIIFYMCALFSLFILISVLVFDEDKIEKTRRMSMKSQKNIHFSLIEGNKKKNNIKNNNKLLNLINKNILMFFFLVLLLESTPTCVSPLFYYQINVLGLNPQSLGLIDFSSQITTIVFILIYNNFLIQFNFKSITFVVRILIYGSYYLIYLLITKSTQKYISDFALLAISSSLYAGLHNLGQLPYNFLCIKFSSIGLEATTDSFSIFFLYLGNMFADYIDYSLALYFNVTRYDFSNLGMLVFIDNLINLIPLIFMFFCPKEFFSTKKEKDKDKDKDNFPSSSMELKLIDKKNNENENNNNENIEEYKTKQTKDILENFVVNDYEDSYGNIANDLSLTIQNSYRYAGW